MAQPRDFGFDDDTAMLKDAVRRFLDENEPITQLRRDTAGSEDPYHGTERTVFFDPAAWQQMVDLGWHLLAVPEAAGGAGMGLVAAAAIQEEIGRAAMPSPLTGTLQCTFVLRAAGAQTLLEKIAAGTSMALATSDEAGSLTPGSTDATATGDVLNGTSWYVQDAGKADGFVVAARDNGGTGLYYVARESVEVLPDRIVDLTRDQARLQFENTKATVIAEPGTADAVLTAALPALLTLVAADIAGAAEWQLNATAEYARVRTQFDRPIGFFQAVKHPVVNMMIAADETRSLVYNAACAFDHDPDDALRCARMAKSSAADTATFCSNRSTQLHGGIGFTWESDVQVYHKRQMHSQYLFGDASWQREQLAALL